MSKVSPQRMAGVLTEHYGIITEAAEILGCNRATIYNYVHRYPVVEAALAEGRERLLDLAESGLVEHLRERAPWAISLTLRTAGRSRGWVDRPTGQVPLTPDVEDTAEWAQVCSVLLRALEAFPEARMVAAEALNGRTHEDRNGNGASS
jgi:hypothetical protein